MSLAERRGIAIPSSADAAAIMRRILRIGERAAQRAARGNEDALDQPAPG
jgi:hypothetical protein